MDQTLLKKLHSDEQHSTSPCASVGKALKHVRIRKVQLKFSLFKCFCAWSVEIEDIMSLLIHTHKCNG